ncbi:MAG: 6-carboxytetrahydropterin synthase QueD, partial [Desulfobacteraceae bacterium 4572_123]
MLTITKEFVFSAAHRLCQNKLSFQENRALYGKCCDLHGHTYRLRVSVAGAIDAAGMIIHFADLKKIVTNKIVSRYD